MNPRNPPFSNVVYQNKTHVIPHPVYVLLIMKVTIFLYFPMKRGRYIFYLRRLSESRSSTRSTPPLGLSICLSATLLGCLVCVICNSKSFHKCGSRGGDKGSGSPPGKSQVIWVSIGNKQLDPLGKSWTPPGKCWTPSGTLKNDRFHLN